MRNRNRAGWRKYVNLVTIATLVTALFITLPLYWLIATSFKNPNSIGSSPPSLGPTPFSGGNYSNAFVGYDFGIYFRNSLVVTIVSTALVLALGTLAGYALGRLPMRGKFTTMVALLMITATAGKTEIISRATIVVNVPRMGSRPSAYPARVPRASTSAVVAMVTTSEFLK